MNKTEQLKSEVEDQDFELNTFFDTDYPSPTNTKNENDTKTEKKKIKQVEPVEKIENIDLIPIELVRNIAEFLPVQELKNFRLSSKTYSNFFKIIKKTTETNHDPKNDNQNDLYLTLEFDEKIKDAIGCYVECTSHDQGWATGGGSCTWGDIVLKSEEETNEIERRRIFTNDRASSQWKTHFATFSDAQFLKNLEKSNSISVYLRSEYPGWRCFGKNASISIIFKNFK